MNDNILLWIGVIAFAVLLFGVLFSRRLKAIFSINRFHIETEQDAGKDNTLVKNIKSGSDLDIQSPKDRNIHIEDVEKSNVKIRK